METRSTRFSGYVTPKLIETATVTISGCGAIGRQVAMQLASMGVRDFTLIDPDTIDETNLGTQGWSPRDLGKEKTAVLSEELLAKNMHIHTINTVSLAPKVVCSSGDVERLDNAHEFVCVDSMDVRREIFEAARGNKHLQSRARTLYDTRMGLNACRVLCCKDIEDDQAAADYEATLFSSAEAEQAPCTMKSTIYCANIAAGLAVSRFIEMLRASEGRIDTCFIESDVQMNIPGNLMFTGTPELQQKKEVQNA